MQVVHSSSGVTKEVNQEEKQLYNILSELPKPETKFGLTAAQKYWWYWFGNEFVQTKQVSKVDLIHLQNAAIWLDARNSCLKMINKLNRNDPNKVKGWVQTFANGANNITGYVSILEKADKHLDNVSAHFGLSIKDRQKLKPVEVDSGQLSLWEKVISELKPAQ